MFWCWGHKPKLREGRKIPGVPWLSATLTKPCKGPSALGAPGWSAGLRRLLDFLSFWAVHGSHRCLSTDLSIMSTEHGTWAMLATVRPPLVPLLFPCPLASGGAPGVWYWLIRFSGWRILHWSRGEDPSKPAPTTGDYFQTLFFRNLSTLFSTIQITVLFYNCINVAGENIQNAW